MNKWANETNEKNWMNAEAPEEWSNEYVLINKTNHLHICRHPAFLQSELHTYNINFLSWTQKLTSHKAETQLSCLNSAHTKHTGVSLVLNTQSFTRNINLFSNTKSSRHTSREIQPWHHSCRAQTHYPPCLHLCAWFFFFLTPSNSSIGKQGRSAAHVKLKISIVLLPF